MACLTFVKSLRDHMMALLCLVSVVSASTGLVSRSHAQTATATATAQWTITGSGWFLGTTKESDDGGNYNFAGFNPFSVTSTVHIGDTVLLREGTITVVQVFLVAPYTGPYPTLSFTDAETVQASIGDASQTAYAYSSETYSQQGLSRSGGPSVTVPDPSWTASDGYSQSISLSGFNSGFTITAVIHAEASETGTSGVFGAPGGPGCSYKSASLKRKIVNGLR